jgi:glycosyltransferase involved in cell wall biosynthesis
VHVASGREWRGGQRQVLLLARALAANPAVDVLVVTGRKTLLAERLTAAGVRVSDVGWGPGLDPRVAAHLFRELEPGSLVHAHDGHAHALADAVARLRHVPVVVSRRDIPAIRHPRRYERAAAIIAISRAVRRAVLDSGVPEDRIHVVPDGVDLDAVLPARASTTDAPPHLVCMAALKPVKGVDVLLEAAALIKRRRPEVRWTVLGDGPERGRLEARRATLGLADTVTFAGFVADPLTTLMGATVAVQPSRREALGSSVLDALALGVPVVASDVDGLPEALAWGGGVLVPPEDPQALAAAVERILADPALHASLSTAGTSAARHFGTDQLVAGTLDVYRSIMQQPSSR